MDQTNVRGQKTIICLGVEVSGIVQGVGFRPFVYNLASRYSLMGWVYNSGRGVSINLEGPGGLVEEFLREMENHPPPLAKITGIKTSPLPIRGYNQFQIIKSSAGGEKDIMISPDVALCPDCRREISDPEDRRHLYPFTNCTNCGPRFTIMGGVPYDRENTSMSFFSMCGPCRGEYSDPQNRRFHAQPNACPNCGPRVFLTDRDGKELSGHWRDNFRRLILDGNIVAVKGVGGFHLACDARNGEAVARLRRRKNRPARAFAVMCRDLEAAGKYCLVSREEARLMASPEAPIVILDQLQGCDLPSSVAPNTGTLGVMLPYTPLHVLLFGPDLDTLIMTSGNVTDLPLVKDNQAALDELGQVTDYFLLHDREIYHSCDDSLARVIAGEVHLYRRSRGFAPLPVPVPGSGSGRGILGAGGEMKNTFCLLEGDRAVLSQHLGEMTFREGADHFMVTLERLQNLFAIEPRIIAHDMHPQYRITSLLRQLPAREFVPVQHHHAHMASCMAENGLDREVVGVICDGTGFGDDGCIWGFEILAGGYRSFERKYHLSYVPLPGGEASIKNTWRMAVAYLNRYLGQEGLKLATSVFPRREKEIALVSQLLQKGFNSPLTSSCGRLFDAVSALLGVCLVNTYEGQGAIEFGRLVNPAIRESYPFSVSGGLIDPGPMLEGIAHHLRVGEDTVTISTMFHNTVILMILEAVERVCEETGISQVVLSGGTFQNRHLFLGVSQGLAEKGCRVYFHRQVPANDGGISLGQAMVAAHRFS